MTFRPKSKVLDNIDEIPWGSIKHAYGFANDVPNQIRELASTDAEIQKKTLWNLYGNIFHQGTRYQATPYAVPFLYELIENDKVLGRDKLIYFLVNIALGYEAEYLPDGINISTFRLAYEMAEENMTSEQRLENKKYGYSPMAILDCYREVAKGIPILHNLINHEDKLISRAAIYALAWFPERANLSIKLIQNVINSFNDEKDIANAILALGLLSRNSKNEVDDKELNAYLNSASQLVKITTAISLAKVPLSTQILNLLIEGILSNGALQNVKDVHFNEGNISGYVSKVLSKYGEAQKEKIIPALCEVLKSVNPYQSLDVTASIIEIINRNRTTSIIETKVIDLEKIVFFALTAIVNYGGWDGFANYSLLMSDSGMPDSRAKLMNYLKHTF